MPVLVRIKGRFMKKLLFMIVVLVFLFGCNTERGNPDRKIILPDKNGNSMLFIYKVNDVDLECIATGQGRSCNWEKHNILIKNK